jgi:histidyl-tRNA synthetase
MMIDAPRPEVPDVAVVPIGPVAEGKVMSLLALLRPFGVSADVAYRGNLKKRMARASASGAKYAIIFGEDEIARNEVSVKDLETGQQVVVTLSDLTRNIIDRKLPEWTKGISFVGNMSEQ